MLNFKKLNIAQHIIFLQKMAYLIYAAFTFK